MQHKFLSAFLIWAFCLSWGVPAPAQVWVSGNAKIAGNATLTYSAASTLNPGWTLVSDGIYGDCTVGVSICTQVSGAPEAGILPHYASGDVAMLYVLTGNSNVTITSAYGCEITSGNCTSGNATETFSEVSGSACHVYNSGYDNVDAVYLNSTVSGTDAWTANLSGNTASYVSMGIIVLAPPAGYTGSYNSCGASSSTSCSSCTGAATTPSSTDAIVQVADTANSSYWPQGLFAWSGLYQTDYQGNGLCMNCASGVAPTLNFYGAQYSAITGMDFTSTAGNFNTPAPNFSAVQYITVPSGASEGSFGGSTQSCSSGGCSFTISSTGSGNLLFLTSASEVTGYISSVSGACSGSWTAPTGYRLSSQSSGYASIAYCLSSSSGATSITIDTTATESYGFALWEVHRNSGSWAVDEITTASNTVSSTYELSGPALSSASGTNDAVFQIMVAVSTLGANSLLYQVMPGPWQGFFNIVTSEPQVGNTLLLNTTNFGATTWMIPEGSGVVSTLAAAFE